MATSIFSFKASGTMVTIPTVTSINGPGDLTTFPGGMIKLCRVA
jgi:hypothetical protein